MRIALLRVGVVAVCIIICGNCCHAQAGPSTPIPQLFYNDSVASQRTISQLAVDNAGNVISFTLQNSIDCGFGICGAVIYSIAPNGSLNWVTSDVNYVANRVNQVAIDSSDNIFFQDFSLEGIRALSLSGGLLPNWPVSLGTGINTSPSTLLIDPIDQTVLAKGGATSGFEPPSTRTASFHQDGTPKWITALAGGSAGTPGMVLGPNGGVYTFSDHTVLLDRTDGHIVCEFPSDSFVPLAGGDGLVFSYSATQVLRSDGGCIGFPIYTWDAGRQGALVGYDQGTLIAADFPIGGVAGTSRLLGLSKDGIVLWQNDLLTPQEFVAVKQGLIYVIGVDQAFPAGQKLYVIKELDGSIAASVSLTSICQACRVAVGTNALYIGDLSSTAIYKVDGLGNNTGITSEWRMEGVNPSRTNVAPVKGPEAAPFFKVLATNVAGNLRRIALDGSLIIVDHLENNSFGSVSSYRTDGTLKWATTLAVGSVGIVDAAVATDGSVYISTVDTVTALNGNTGQPMWSFSGNPGSESSSLAVGKDGTIYYHNGGGTIGFVEALTAINPNGSLEWQEFPGFRGYTTAVFNTDESLAYLLNLKTCCGGLPIGNISSFSTVDGHKVNDTPCDPRGDVYVFSQWGALYSGHINNDLLAFSSDIQNCTAVSTDNMSAGAIATTTTTGRIITRNNDGTLGGLDQRGALLWLSTEPLSQAFSSADAVIYAVAPVTNDLVALESEHGAVLWRQHFNDQITGDFLADDGNIYLTAGSTIFVSSPAPPLGAIVVSTDNSAAAFTISDGGSNTFSGNGTSFTRTVPAGKYTITYEPVPGFITPPPETKTLDSNSTIEFIASYLQHIAVSPNTLAFGYPKGAAGIIPQQQLSVQTSATPVHLSISTSTETGGNWLSISGATLTTPANILVGVSSNLPEGRYQGAVHIHAFGGVDSNDLLVPVSLTVGPPAAVQINVELLDPSPVLENMQIVSPDTPAHISLLSSPTLQPLEGAATDGVSKLLLRVSVSQPGEIVLFLTDSLGEVSLPPEEAGTIPPDTLPTVGDNKVFAVYGAPNQFARLEVTSDEGASQRQVYVRVAFIPPDGPALRSELFPIVLERPPIVLVHGLWSDDSAWDDFPLISSVGCADTEKFYACRLNYGPDAANTFAAIASEIGPALRAKVAQFRKDRHVAALQADVIAHSMGGDIIRTLPLCNTIAVPACTFTYKTSANLGFGDVHSLVTVGTPHLGTPVANDLIQHLNTQCCPYPTCFGRGPLFRDAFKSITGNSLDGGAVQDLQENSTAINSLRSSTAAFPMHFVVGIANSDDEALLDQGLIKSIRDQCSSSILPEHVRSIFNMDSDLLVPETSQRNTSVIVPSHCVTRSLDLIHANLLASPGQTGFSPEELSFPSLGLDILKLLDSPASFCK